MANKACSYLIEADEYFNNGVVDENKFNKNDSLKDRCPYENRSPRPCKNDYERINALAVYLYENLSKTGKNISGTGHHENRHIEFFMMWLSDKLFKIENDYKATLEESYNKHLDKHTGNYKYWRVLNSKKVYKDATIRKMSAMYTLLTYICKLITEYNKHNKNPKNISSSDRDILVKSSSQSVNYYKTIHNSVNGCKPYLHLLDSLKKVYENFRSARIINNKGLDNVTKGLLSKRVEPFKTFGNEDKYFVLDSEVLSFDNEECGKVKTQDEELGKQIASKGSPSKQQGSGNSKKPITGTQTQPSGDSSRGTNDQSGKVPTPGKAGVPSPPQSGGTNPAATKPVATKPAPAKPAPAKPATPKSPGPKPAAPAPKHGLPPAKPGSAQTAPGKPASPPSQPVPTPSGASQKKVQHPHQTKQGQQPQQPQQPQQLQQPQHPPIQPPPVQPPPAQPPPAQPP
ncbi:CIR protein, partial [Plasmodium chabaudi chabaudi]